MKLVRLLSFLVIGLLGLSLAFAAEAKPKKARPSPHDVVEANIDGNEVKITYGRPHTKNPKTGELRTVWGGLVPYGQVWRTGADEATILSTQKPIVLGGHELAAGKYSLFTVPTATGGELIINRKTGQWGIPYHEAEEKSNELARVPLTRAEAATALEQFTISITPTGSGAGTIKFAWADAVYSVDFKNQQ